MFLQLLHLFNYFRVGLPRSTLSSHSHSQRDAFPSLCCHLAHFVQFTLLLYFLLSVFAAEQTSDCLPEIAEISFRRLSSQRHNCVKSQTST